MRNFSRSEEFNVTISLLVEVQLYSKPVIDHVMAPLETKPNYEMMESLYMLCDTLGKKDATQLIATQSSGYHGQEQWHTALWGQKI